MALRLALGFTLSSSAKLVWEGEMFSKFWAFCFHIVSPSAVETKVTEQVPRSNVSLRLLSLLVLLENRSSDLVNLKLLLFWWITSGIHGRILANTTDLIVLITGRGSWQTCTHACLRDSWHVEDSAPVTWPIPHIPPHLPAPSFSTFLFCSRVSVSFTRDT